MFWADRLNIPGQMGSRIINLPAGALVNSHSSRAHDPPASGTAQTAGAGVYAQHGETARSLGLQLAGGLRRITALVMRQHRQTGGDAQGVYPTAQAGPPPEPSRRLLL